MEFESNPLISADALAKQPALTPYPKCGTVPGPDKKGGVWPRLVFGIVEKLYAIPFSSGA
jgi:hypothetical protein